MQHEHSTTLPETIAEGACMTCLRVVIQRCWQILKSQAEDARVYFGILRYFNPLCCAVQVYGYESIKKGLSSEQLVGRFTKSLPAGKAAPVVATKFFTIPWTNLLVGEGLRSFMSSLLRLARFTGMN